ncbi:hypothetical protein [Cetobacterium sp.]|uniref:hypothetical protein n=1 Tax=Cetobacterium sp. TaxID=2071632 RepID=UPI003F67DD75
MKLFSKQLEYSYLLYILLKESTETYLKGEEIIQKTDVPKSWGLRLLTHMVNRGIIGSQKGKGFFSLSDELNFWEFYVSVETLNFESIRSNKSDERRLKYKELILNIGIEVQEKMKQIKI